MLESEFQMTTVKFFDGDSNFESFRPFGFVLMIINNGSIFVLGTHTAAEMHDARNGLTVLVTDTDRHFNIFIRRLRSTREFPAGQRQVQIVTHVPWQNDFREAQFATDCYITHDQSRMLFRHLSNISFALDSIKIGALLIIMIHPPV